jgi:hypothetical protein
VLGADEGDCGLEDGEVTIARRYGEDTPFGKWVREQRELDSHQFSLTLNDADWIFHRYRTEVDAVGTRDLQCMMVVETKMYYAVPRQPQLETLFFLHQMLNRKGVLRRPGKPSVALWSYGVFVLSLQGTHPGDSRGANWGRFDERGQLNWTPIESRQQLIEILRFDLTPDTLEPLSTRRHHKTRIFWKKEDRGLIHVWVPVTERS